LVKAVPKIFELFHPFKGTIINRYNVTSSRIPISRHDHVLSITSIFSQYNFLTSSY